MEKQATAASTSAAAENSRKRPASASNAPNQSITAPEPQTPPEPPETAKESARAVVPVMIAPEVYSRLAEYGAAHGGQSPDGLTVRAITEYLEQRTPKARPAESVKTFQRICRHYREVILAEIDACEYSPEQEAEERKKAAVFGCLLEFPKVPPLAFRYFFDDAEPEFSSRIGRELDALDVVQEALGTIEAPVPLA